MSFIRNTSGINNNVGSEQIRDLSNHSLADLTRVVRGWQQHLNDVFSTLPVITFNEPATPIPAINQPVEIQNSSKKPKKTKKRSNKSSANQESVKRRKTTNKPPRLKHADGSIIQAQELVSSVDGTLLTADEKNNLRRGPRIHQEFCRDEQWHEAVPNEQWWSEYIWVHPIPVNGRVVYVHPQEYKNIKQTAPQVLNGMPWNNLFTYGEPPVYAVRYGLYRKKYDLNNIPLVDNDLDIDTLIQSYNTNQSVRQITANPLYLEEQSPSPKRMSNADSYLIERVSVDMPNNFAAHAAILFNNNNNNNDNNNRNNVRAENINETDLQSNDLFFNNQYSWRK